MIDSVQRPVACFITFEYEEGKNRASNHNHVANNVAEYSHYKTLLKEPLVLKQASEPSNIIWENRSYTKVQRISRGQVVCAIMSLILAISFLIIYVASYKAQEMYERFPVQDCAKMERKYEGQAHDF